MKHWSSGFEIAPRDSSAMRNWKRMVVLVGLTNVDAMDEIESPRLLPSAALSKFWGRNPDGILASGVAFGTGASEKRPRSEFPEARFLGLGENSCHQPTSIKLSEDSSFDDSSFCLFKAGCPTNQLS